MDLEKAARYHLGVLRAENASPSTQRTYSQVHRQFSAFLLGSLGKPATLADLTPDNAREWQAHLREHLDPVTVAHYVRILKIWSNRLVNDLPELFPSGDPLAKLRNPRVPERVVTAFSPEQVRRMVDLCAQTREPLRNRALILFLVDTGVRAEELCAIRLDQIDAASREHQGRALIMGKGRKERFVAFGMETSAAIAKYIVAERYDREQPWLFLSRIEGRQFTVHGLGDLVRNLGERAGIEGMRCSPHVFRHTFAREFLRAHPGQILQLQQLLGHSTLEQSQKYARLVQSDVVDDYHSVVDGWRRKSATRAIEPRRPFPLPKPTSASRRRAG